MILSTLFIFFHAIMFVMVMYESYQKQVEKIAYYKSLAKPYETAE